MNNLVIIGNGFDLAHGLKTSYNDFIKYIIDSKFKNEELFEDLYRCTVNPVNYKNLIAHVASGSDRSAGVIWENEFFNLMISNVAKSNWCDVEKLYYDQLIKDDVIPKKINADFEIVKGYLEEYLNIEKDNFNKQSSYAAFFSHLKNTPGVLILNFNYTNTVIKYDEINPSLNIINIHGELKNGYNPIIFGFAADDDESRKLINKNDKEYMRNIKKHCYKRTRNVDVLADYLKSHKKIDISILGHSCGISDKLILNQILNSDNVEVIKIFYHESYEKYFETQVNIDRIMNNDEKFTKLLNFEDSHRMPQKDDDGSQTSSFNKFVSSFLESQKRRQIPVVSLDFADRNKL